MDKKITLLNHFLYYIMVPILLIYFVALDFDWIKPTVLTLGIFAAVFIAGFATAAIYKSKNKSYKYEMNSLYGKIMTVLVFLELMFSFMK